MVKRKRQQRPDQKMKGKMGIDGHVLTLLGFTEFLSGADLLCGLSCTNAAARQYLKGAPLALSSRFLWGLQITKRFRHASCGVYRLPSDFDHCIFLKSAYHTATFATCAKN